MLSVSTVSKVNQLYVYIYSLFWILDFLPIQVTTEY